MVDKIELETRLARYWEHWRNTIPSMRWLLAPGKEKLEELLTQALISNNVLDWGRVNKYDFTGWQIVTESTLGGPVYALERLEDASCKIDFGV